MWYDADNRQMVRPVPVVVGKVPGKMQIPDDFYEVLEVVPGRPPGMFGCHLGTIPDLIAAKGVPCPVRRC